MAERNESQVVIDGKMFTLSGFESSDYLQRIAGYINNKISEYGKVESFRRQSVEMQSILLQINIADDYFKAKKQIELLQEELQTREKELYDLKHELITTQIKIETLKKEAKKG